MNIRCISVFLGIESIEKQWLSEAEDTEKAAEKVAWVFASTSLALLAAGGFLSTPLIIAGSAGLCISGGRLWMLRKRWEELGPKINEAKREINGEVETSLKKMERDVIMENDQKIQQRITVKQALEEDPTRLVEKFLKPDQQEKIV